MRDEPIENYEICHHPDVIFIDPRNYVDTVINDIYSCENIITSSLHSGREYVRPPHIISYHLTYHYPIPQSLNYSIALSQLTH